MLALFLSAFCDFLSFLGALLPATNPYRRSTVSRDLGIDSIVKELSFKILMPNLVNVKSIMTVLPHHEHYDKTRLVKIANGDLAYTEDVLTLPHYMAFLLFPWSPTLPLE